ncbi:MAG: shikimate dehydrogenase, partial [Actinomyces sp.]|nr:shikimate dehydrogenase [Actinomyces sp.]
CSQADRTLPTSAVVLGARATASSALAALGELGIVTSTVAARRFGGPGSVVAASSRLGVSIEQVLWSDRDAVLRAVSGADLVISTLPAGVADPLAEEMTVREGQVLLDVVYSPRETALRSAFERNGGIVAEGTDMLIYQAAAQVQLMTGRSPKTDVMRGALEAELARRARVNGGGTAS